MPEKRFINHFPFDASDQFLQSMNRFFRRRDYVARNCFGKIVEQCPGDTFACGIVIPLLIPGKYECKYGHQEQMRHHGNRVIPSHTIPAKRCRESPYGKKKKHFRTWDIGVEQRAECVKPAGIQTGTDSRKGFAIRFRIHPRSFHRFQIC